ncbi:MAG: RNA polymerase sigma factor [bacterium]
MVEEELRSPGQASDDALVARLKEGYEDAFEALVERYKKRAYYFAYGMLSNHEDAEDVSQEAFVRVYKHIDSFREKASFKTWLYRIIINLCRSNLRKRYLVSKFSFNFRQKNEMTDEVEKTLETAVTDTHWESDPLKSTANKQLQKAIHNAISTLSVKQKEAFVLKHMQGMKISEIADMLGCAEGTVKAHISRAIGHLKQNLRDYEQEVD